MNNQQQVDKKRHSRKMMQSKSLNVTATSLISVPSFSRSSEASIKQKERERGRVASEGIKRKREERKKRKEWNSLFGNSYRN
jgi:hypothetical protein